MSSILLLSKRCSESLAREGRGRSHLLLETESLTSSLSSFYYLTANHSSPTFISQVLLLFFAVISLALGLYTDFGADPEQVPCADPPPGQEGCNAAKVSRRKEGS